MEFKGADSESALLECLKCFCTSSESRFICSLTFSAPRGDFSPKLTAIVKNNTRVNDHLIDFNQLTHKILLERNEETKLATV